MDEYEGLERAPHEVWQADKHDLILRGGWDPDSSRFDSRAVAELQAEVASSVDQLQRLIERLTTLGPGLGLVRPEFEAQLMPRWNESAGSPLFLLRTAVSHLAAIGQGTICKSEFPWAPRQNDPPPANRWCCVGHETEHCVDM
jgi:hypothetical protein